jgi:hypothetical protein
VRKPRFRRVRRTESGRESDSVHTVSCPQSGMSYALLLYLGSALGPQQTLDRRRRVGSFDQQGLCA